MGIFLANREAPSRCTATDCLVVLQTHQMVGREAMNSCIEYTYLLYVLSENSEGT